MIITGIILLIVVWALPQIFPNAAPPVPALEHIGWVIGILLIVLGVVLLLFGRFSGHTIGGRRYWY
jgi:MFS family permease